MTSRELMDITKDISEGNEILNNSFCGRGLEYDKKEQLTMLKSNLRNIKN